MFVTFAGVSQCLVACQQDFVQGFINHRRQYFHPINYIITNESFLEWLGLCGSYINVGLPMFVAMDKKPRVGCEIQDSADGDSGVMLQLSLVKSSEEASVSHCKGKSKAMA